MVSDFLIVETIRQTRASSTHIFVLSFWHCRFMTPQTVNAYYHVSSVNSSSYFLVGLFIYRLTCLPLILASAAKSQWDRLPSSHFATSFLWQRCWYVSEACVNIKWCQHWMCDPLWIQILKLIRCGYTHPRRWCCQLWINGSSDWAWNDGECGWWPIMNCNANCCMPSY